MKCFKILALGFFLAQSTYGFVSSPNSIDTRRVANDACDYFGRKFWPLLSSNQLPSVEELASDPFMKQVSHSEKVVQMLSTDPDASVELLKAQLGHSDGIRGFFVTYLTMMGDSTPADLPEVPPALLSALQEAANEKELVSLACMNVIMPCAMITMHKDEELSQQSQKTAERGVRVLRALRDKPIVQEECAAILTVANDAGDDKSADPARVAYWEEFFEKWGYKDRQKRDIATSIQSVLSG